MIGSRTFRVQLPYACEHADASYISGLLQRAGFTASVVVSEGEAVCSLERRFTGEIIRRLKKYVEDSVASDCAQKFIF